MVGQRGDHAGVVGAELGRCQPQTEPALGAGAGQLFTEPAVDRDSAGQADGLDPVLLGGPEQLTGEHIHDRFLETGAEVRDGGRRVLAEKIEHGGLEPAKAEIVARLIKHAPREGNRAGVAGLGEVAGVVTSARSMEACQRGCVLRRGELVSKS